MKNHQLTKKPEGFEPGPSYREATMLTAIVFGCSLLLLRSFRGEWV